MYYLKFDKSLANEKIYDYIQNPKTFIVKLFPYYNGKNDGNISKYAQGLDYHIVVKQELEKLILSLKSKYKNSKFISFCDNSPLKEVEIAYKSGAGILGKNHLIFDTNYGGYVFIGIIVTDAEINYAKKSPKTCINCNLCVKSCPNNAISDNGIIEEKCLSYITQKNDENKDKSLIKNSKLIWGCDICLDVCPMNKCAKVTYIDAFKQNIINHLTLDDVSNLTRAEFLAKYKNRAFTFRGPKPLAINLSIKNNLLL